MSQARWEHPHVGSRARPGFNTKEADLGDKGVKAGTQGRMDRGARVCLGLLWAENLMRAGETEQKVIPLSGGGRKSPKKMQAFKRGMEPQCPSS